jgi:molybdopterin-guanine dinucleotide biosynthesis protein A
MLKTRIKQSDIACAIMAGGQNRRMGRHKAFLSYQGKQFINLVWENMENWFEDIFIVTNNRKLFTRDFSPVYEDIIPAKGPLGAVYTALSVAETEYVFCVACDMPNPCDSVISRLIQASHDNHFDCFVPKGSRGIEPLFALYRKSLINLIEEELAAIQLSIHGIFDKCHTKYIDINFEEEGLININTPGDYMHYTREINSVH